MCLDVVHISARFIGCDFRNLRKWTYEQYQTFLDQLSMLTDQQLYWITVFISPNHLSECLSAMKSINGGSRVWVGAYRDAKPKVASTSKVRELQTIVLAMYVCRDQGAAPDIKDLNLCFIDADHPQEYSKLPRHLKGASEVDKEVHEVRAGEHLLNWAAAQFLLASNCVIVNIHFFCHSNMVI